MGGFTRHMTKQESEIRTENRYILHKQDKKRCTHCKRVFENIRECFDIHHKRKDGSYGFSGKCKTCLSDQREKRLTSYKQDIALYSMKLLPHIRGRAKANDLPFDLDADFLTQQWKSQNGKCYYTSKLMDLQAVTESRKSSHPMFPSLDRLIPNDGYTRDNVVWCTWRINKMKNDFSEREFVECCKRVVENQCLDPMDGLTY